jgi:N-acetylmuramoyl-L-alanine amidase
MSVTVEYRAEGSTRKTSGRILLLGSREIYLRSAAVAAVFKASRSWELQLQKLTLRVRDRSFQLTAGSRLVIHDEGEVLLPVPILAIDGDVWLPMEFLTRILGPVAGETVLWDAETRTLAVGSASYNIVRLRVETLTKATAVTLQCSEPLSYRADATEPGFIVLKVYGAQPDPATVVQSRPRGLIQRVHSRQFGDHAKVYVEVNDLVTRYRTFTRDEGKEIVLVVEEAEVTALPEPTPRGKLRVGMEDRPVDVTRPIDVRTVVIDPGHGGMDRGRVGPSGVAEKDVNLAVARYLKRQLERNSDLEVVLTRDRDEHLDLAQRAEIANRAQGDVFISLHCNGWFNQGASGIETYFLSPAESDWAKSVAASENQGLDDTDVLPEDVTFIVWELVQNKFISASSDLAELVQQETIAGTGARDRGVRQAGFRVLVGAYMPAVLIEMGFISNVEEERRLDSGSYQQDLARAMSNAILEFKERYAEKLQAVQSVDGKN